MHPDEMLTDPPAAARVLASYRGKLAFDIGAHRGEAARVIAPHFEQVVAVEPWQDNWEHLEAVEGNVVIEKVACSRYAGYVSLAVNSDHIEAGHLTSAHMGTNDADWAASMGWGTYTGEVVVPAVTVDDLATRYGVPNLIKCDVEGHEVDVFAGAQATISERPNLYIEVHHASLGDILMDMLRPVYGRSIERIVHPFYRVDSWHWSNHYFLVTRPVG